MSVERLLNEFGGQDCGSKMVCLIAGKHIEVATWNNANSCWNILPAGHALLAPVKAAETTEPVEPAPKRMGRPPKGLAE